MDSVEDRNVMASAGPEHESAPARDQAGSLTYFWSVMLPRWLDPWAPRLADSFADGAWTAGCRGLAAVAPLAALIVGILIPDVFPGMRYVYTESLLFLTLIIAGAILSGPVGVMMLLGYVTATLVWGSANAYVSNYWLDYIFRRSGSLLISYLLLAIPAIMVPQQARWMSEEVPLPSKAGPAVRDGLVALIYAAGAGLLVYLWSHAMVVLIRPVFTWARMNPEVGAIAPLQREWGWLVAGAVVAAAVRIALEGLVVHGLPPGAVVAELQKARWNNSERHGEFWRSVPVWVKAGLASASITLLFAGVYEGWIDALLVAAATAGLELWRAGVIGGFAGWWERALLKVPALLRFVIALVIGYLLSQWMITRWWQTGSFRPVLVATVLTLAIFYLLFPRRATVKEAAVERKETA